MEMALRRSLLYRRIAIPSGRCETATAAGAVDSEAWSSVVEHSRIEGAGSITKEERTPQAAAPIEGIRLNSADAVGDSDARQAAATRERPPRIME